MCGLWPLTPNRVWASRKPLTHTQTNIEVFGRKGLTIKLLLTPPRTPQFWSTRTPHPLSPGTNKNTLFPSDSREKVHAHKKGGGELIFCCGIQKQKSGYKIIITIVH